jgi:phosphoglycerol transferase
VQRLPAGAMIFELPYVPFPEGYPPGSTHDYDPGHLYIHADRLRWSYGAMKGRPEDWSASLVEKPLRQVSAGVSGAGFAGIVIDRAGYTGRFASLERSLGKILGSRSLVGGAGRYAFFDLRAYAVRLRSDYSPGELAALREATLTPPRVLPSAGFSPQERVAIDGHRSLWAVRRQASLDLYEPGRAQTVTFYASLLRSASAHPPIVTITWPDGTRTFVRASSSGGQLAHKLRLRHGSNRVELSLAAPPIRAPWDPRTLYLAVVDARFAEAAFDPFSGRAGKAIAADVPPLASPHA